MQHVTCVTDSCSFGINRSVVYPLWETRPRNFEFSEERASVIEVLVDVADGQAAGVEDSVGKRPLGYGRTSNPPEDTLPTGVRPIKNSLFGGQPELVG